MEFLQPCVPQVNVLHRVLVLLFFFFNLPTCFILANISKIFQHNIEKLSSYFIFLYTKSLNMVYYFLLKIFIQFLKLILHLQLLKNTGYIPHVVQYSSVVDLTPNSLYLPLPHPYTAAPPLVTTSLFSVSVSLLLFCYNH